VQVDNVRLTSPPRPSNLDKETTQLKVIEFIRNKLPIFNYSLGSKAEEDISQELIIYLQREAMADNVLFFFKAEYKEGNRRVDFGVISAIPFADTKAFFVIEAKRLSTDLSKDREKEYVFGNYGGIERFKKNLHGRGLSQSAIIGYVQKEDFLHWFTLINLWIDKAIQQDNLWSQADKLKWGSSGQFSEYVSNHSRIDGSVIRLTHLWIKV